MKEDSDYNCYMCCDLGYVKLDDKPIVAHCWCEAGNANKDTHPKILQAIRGSNFDFKSISPKKSPKTSEEFWEKAEAWKAIIKSSEDFWQKNHITKKVNTPYKDD